MVHSSPTPRGKLLSLFAYRLSNEASLKGKRNISSDAEDGRGFSSFREKIGGSDEKEEEEFRVGLIRSNRIPRANIARRISLGRCRTGIKRRARGSRHFPDTRRSTSLCPKNEKSPTHRFRMR